MKKLIAILAFATIIITSCTNSVTEVTESAVDSTAAASVVTVAPEITVDTTPASVSVVEEVSTTEATSK